MYYHTNTIFLTQWHRYWSIPAVRAIPKKLPKYDELFDDHSGDKLIVDAMSDRNGGEQEIHVLINDSPLASAELIVSEYGNTDTTELCSVVLAKPFDAFDDEEDKRWLYDKLREVWEEEGYGYVRR